MLGREVSLAVFSLVDCGPIFRQTFPSAAEFVGVKLIVFNMEQTLFVVLVVSANGNQFPVLPNRKVKKACLFLNVKIAACFKRFFVCYLFGPGMMVKNQEEGNTADNKCGRGRRTTTTTTTTEQEKRKREKMRSKLYS